MLDKQECLVGLKEGKTYAACSKQRSATGAAGTLNLTLPIHTGVVVHVKPVTFVCVSWLQRQMDMRWLVWKKFDTDQMQIVQTLL